MSFRRVLLMSLGAVFMAWHARVGRGRAQPGRKVRIPAGAGRDRFDRDPARQAPRRRRRHDIFSFSLGGFIAQALVVKHPELVRKLVLTGTGPKGGKDIE
ncbi:alpha/beta fold hydrolase [Streptomyces violaceus]